MGGVDMQIGVSQSATGPGSARGRLRVALLRYRAREWNVPRPVSLAEDMASPVGEGMVVVRSRTSRPATRVMVGRSRSGGPSSVAGEPAPTAPGSGRWPRREAESPRREQDPYLSGRQKSLYRGSRDRAGAAGHGRSAARPEPLALQDREGRSVGMAVEGGSSSGVSNSAYQRRRSRRGTERGSPALGGGPVQREPPIGGPDRRAGQGADEGSYARRSSPR